MIVFVSPLGPQVSNVHKSINSVEVFWLVLSILIVEVRCGVLKKASWLRNVLGVLGVLGFKWLVV